VDQRKRTLSRGVSAILLLTLFWFGFQIFRLVSWLPTEAKIKGCFTTSMYSVDLCPKSPDYVKLANISSWVQKAVVTSEDGRFWTHQGFDLEEIKASIEKNLEKGTLRRGGSTITQQLAKNLFLSRDKTMTRKVIEALITFQLERVLTKKEILEKYLNVVQFGDGIFGIKKAAQHYFRKGPAQLTLAEAAFLAMLLPSPKKYSKSFKLKKLTPYARKRMSQIVYQMRAGDRVPEGAFYDALAQIRSFYGGPVSSQAEDNNSPQEDLSLKPQADEVEIRVLDPAQVKVVPSQEELDYTEEIAADPGDEGAASEDDE